MQIVAENLLAIYPLLHRNLYHFNRYSSGTWTGSQNAVLGLLEKCGKLPVSEIGKRLDIAKPNMTPLINHLIKEGKVVRYPDLNDRRIINIDISLFGKKCFMENRVQSLKNIQKKLILLTDTDLDRLDTSLRCLMEIITKLNQMED